MMQLVQVQQERGDKEQQQEVARRSRAAMKQVQRHGVETVLARVALGAGPAAQG